MGVQIQSTARFRAEDQEVMDAIGGSQAVAQVRTARLRLSLMLEHEGPGRLPMPRHRPASPR